MEHRTIVVALLASLGLFACGGAAHKQQDAQSAENLWSGYKGTYATAGAAKSADAKPTPKKAEAKEAAAPQEEATGEHAAAAAPAGKKASKATIHGESISSIDADALADFSKGALKANVLSTGGQVGPQYESVKVELKGATVQIIRPATTPNPNGVSVPSPKAKNATLAKTDSGFYDEDADVLVFVSGSKNAKKTLGSLVKK